MLRYNATSLNFENQDVPYTILVGRVAGKPAAGAILLDINLDTAIRLPENLLGSRITGLTAATAIADFLLWKGGAAAGTDTTGATNIGTIRVAAAGLVGAGILHSAEILAAGDRLRIQAPLAQDATYAEVSITLKAIRS
jgi:hypothetical protein